MEVCLKTFAEFYPYYLGEHQNRTCRRLHFLGSVLALAFAVKTVYTGNVYWIIAALLSGYAFAWIGHFFFERNKPATFKHPFFSFLGDWVMFKDILTGKIKF
jgi:hypothetical protein